MKRNNCEINHNNGYFLLLLQDTADYVKPVTFSVHYELESSDSGPVMDDGWPTSLKVAVRKSCCAVLHWKENRCVVF